jgi:hypothetical protein
MNNITQRRKLMNHITIAVIASIICASALHVTNKTLAMPDVWFSYSTNECVKVINYTDEIFSCETLPSKFNHVWVD